MSKDRRTGDGEVDGQLKSLSTSHTSDATLD